MMNKKLIALFVAIATVSAISAHRDNYDNREYDNREYDNRERDNSEYENREYDNRDRRRFRPVRNTVRETGNLAEKTVKTPGRILFGRD